MTITDIITDLILCAGARCTDALRMIEIGNDTVARMFLAGAIEDLTIAHAALAPVELLP